MTENRKEFFRTEELHRLHPELNVRDAVHDGKDYVIFSNPGNLVNNAAPEWPVGLDLWVEHNHERGVDGGIYDPLRFYADRRGLTELLTGTVYGEIGTMAEVLTQHLFGGYTVDVMFGEWVKISDSYRYFIAMSPYDVEAALDAGSQTHCVMIRVLNDTRLCAINSTACELCNCLYRRIQYANDRFRRYEFWLYPLLDSLHSSRVQIFSVKDYVHFYAAMYNSCIMLAHHDQSRQSLPK